MMRESKPEVQNSARYSVSQTAEILGVHRNTVGNYMKSGALGFSTRATTRKLISGADILKMWRRRDERRKKDEEARGL